MKCYLSIKKNEVLVYSTTWMKLENIVLNETDQTKKGQILCDSTYMKCVLQVTLWKQKIS